MEPLSVRLFGGLEVRMGSGPVRPFPTEKCRSLFAFLVVHRDRSTSREALVERLWPTYPPARARKALRNTLWRLRTVVDPPGSSDEQSVVWTAGQRVGLRLPAGSWIDVEAFDAALKGLDHEEPAGLEESRVREIEAAVGLYRGPFLEEVYDDWSGARAAQVRLRLLRALEALMEYHLARRHWDAAITWGLRILDTDPLREHVHRSLMACHFGRGDRPLALVQYDRCRRLLRAELGIDPMPETTHLYHLVSQDVRAVDLSGLTHRRALSR